MVFKLWVMSLDQGETADVTVRLVFKLWFMSLSKWNETCGGV
jgi:hypothetical protein